MSLTRPPSAPRVIDSPVRGVRLHVLREVRDARGDLCVAEVGPDLPFAVQRSFLVYNVPSAELRGEHAHHRCHQFLMAVKGSIHVIADDACAPWTVCSTLTWKAGKARRRAGITARWLKAVRLLFL